MESNLNEFEKEPRLRPTLLTVLCILTFIGSGYSIVKGVYSYSMAAESVRMFSSSGIRRQNDSTLEKDSVMPFSYNKNLLVTIARLLRSLSTIVNFISNMFNRNLYQASFTFLIEEILRILVYSSCLIVRFVLP